MSSPPRTSLLRRLIGSAAEVPRQDPADMGTAIGMEYVMDQSALPEKPRAPAAGAVARRNWLPRRRP